MDGPKTHDIDKSEWPEGPWTYEPDRVDFEHLGLPCLALRNSMGGWCGYVGVPPGHPMHRFEYNQCLQSCEEPYCEHSPDCLVSAHGGLTYSGACSGVICHVPKPGEPDDVWWFGFDCGHSGDLLPSMIRLQRRVEKEMDIHLEYVLRETYRDLPYVEQEIRQLAEQLKNPRTS